MEMFSFQISLPRLKKVTHIKLTEQLADDEWIDLGVSDTEGKIHPRYFAKRMAKVTFILLVKFSIGFFYVKDFD